MPSRLVPLYRPLVSLPQLHSSLHHSGRTNGYRRHMNERSDHSAMQCLWHQQYIKERGCVPERCLEARRRWQQTDSVDTSPAKLTVCERFVMNDWIQSMTDPRIANADCKQSSRIWWSTMSKAADRSSNANQVRFLVVGKCLTKATKQLCCWSFDNVLMQSWIRNIELCCSCWYGHWTFCLL